LLSWLSIVWLFWSLNALQTWLKHIFHMRLIVNEALFSLRIINLIILIFRRLIGVFIAERLRISQVYFLNLVWIQLVFIKLRFIYLPAQVSTLICLSCCKIASFLKKLLIVSIFFLSSIALSTYISQPLPHLISNWLFYCVWQMFHWRGPC